MMLFAGSDVRHHSTRRLRGALSLAMVKLLLDIHNAITRLSYPEMSNEK